MANVVVAAVQAKPRSASLDEMRAGGELDHAVELLEAARARGVDVACFPEMYPLVGLEVLRREAVRLGMWIVAGLEEPAGSGKTYNTATFISRQGEVVARQRKVYPTDREKQRTVVPGEGYRVVDTEFGRVGAVICSDFAFVSDGVRSLARQGVELLLSPSWWFALAEGLPSVILGRHFEFGVPVVGVNVAKVAIALGNGTDNANAFPAAGGFSTFTCPPPVTSLGELGAWFASKPGGINSVDDICRSLGEDEDILVGSLSLDACRQFPGYFYSAEARGTLLGDIGG